MIPIIESRSQIRNLDLSRTRLWGMAVEPRNGQGGGSLSFLSCQWLWESVYNKRDLLLSEETTIGWLLCCQFSEDIQLSPVVN